MTVTVVLSGMAEELYAVRAADGEADLTFDLLRPLSDEELAVSRADEALLRALTAGSELATLRAMAADFHAAAEEAENASTNPALVQEVGSKVQRAFKSWLSAFRSFDDRTCAWLSKHVNPEAVEHFRGLLSAEYDANFAYRLAAGLRNVSEHAADVINNISMSSSEGADGVHRSTAVIGLDGPALATQFPRMKSSLRAELDLEKNVLGVESVVGAAMLSCENAHAGLLEFLRVELEAAAARCRGLHAEADPDGTGKSTAAFVDISGVQPTAKGQLHFRYNPMDVAELIGRNLLEARSIAAAAPLLCDAEDLQLTEP